MFTVSKRVPGCYLYVYKIQDYEKEWEGTFYEKELQQIIKTDDVYEVEDIFGNTKRRIGRKIIPEVKVRWKWNPPSFDSCIPKTDLIVPNWALIGKYFTKKCPDIKSFILHNLICVAPIISCVVMLALHDPNQEYWMVCLNTLVVYVMPSPHLPKNKTPVTWSLMTFESASNHMVFSLKTEPKSRFLTQRPEVK